MWVVEGSSTWWVGCFEAVEIRLRNGVVNGVRSAKQGTTRGLKLVCHRELARSQDKVGCLIATCVPHAVGIIKQLLVQKLLTQYMIFYDSRCPSLALHYVQVDHRSITVSFHCEKLFLLAGDPQAWFYTIF